MPPQKRKWIARHLSSFEPCKYPTCSPILRPMESHIQFQLQGADHIVWHPNPEDAIEAACVLTDDGCDVYGVGTGPLTRLD